MWERSDVSFFHLSVRLINGFAPYAGQVAVYRRGTWVAVCDDGWDEKDATVVCLELGYPGVTIVTKEMFFGVPGRIKIEQLGCYGNETKLSECSFKTTRKMSQCLNRNRRHREAGVICEVGNHTDPRGIVLQHAYEKRAKIVVFFFLNDLRSYVMLLEH